MEKEHIECPNCGAALPISQLLEIECPYCGSIFRNPLNDEDDGTVIENIIPFSTSEEGAKERLFRQFINKTSVPQDIFEHLKLLPIEQYYLPMYLFVGEYNADWSCTVVYRQKDRQGNEHVDYRPANGVATGYFSKLVLANEGDELPRGMLPFARTFDQMPEFDSAMTVYMPSYLVGEDGKTIKVMPLDMTAKEAWNYLQTPIEMDARDAAYAQMPGQEVKDIHVTPRFQGNLRDLLLFPMWYGQYDYKGQTYYYVIDGMGKQGDFSHPEGRDYRFEIGFRAVIVIVVFIILILGWGFLTKTWAVILSVSIPSLIFLGIRYGIEDRKFIKHIKANKQVGKAKFCNEKIPDVSPSNPHQYRKQNKVLTWGLILLVLIYCFVDNKHSQIVQERYEQMRQQEEQMRIEREQQELQQAQQCFDQAVAWVSSPASFFYTQKKQYGHLRQDIRQHLLELGFLQDESTNYFDHSEIFILKSPKSTSYKYKSIKITLNSSSFKEKINADDDIHDVTIAVHGIDDYKNNFKAALKQCGFSLYDGKNDEFGLVSIMSDNYIRVGTTLPKNEKKYSWERGRDYYANFDVVEISTSISTGDVYLYSKSEIQEVWDTQNDVAVGDSIDNDSLVIGL